MLQIQCSKTFTYLNLTDQIPKDSIINNDLEFLKNRIKSEFVGSIWGKNENTNIRLRF